jgi:outer membrane lipopolysaccharide assembly protein LptE/RlpB
LRGTSEIAVWPEALKQLQLKLDDKGADVFHQALRDGLINSYGVEITSAPVPMLVVSNISRERKVLSLGVTGKASEYLLRFRLQFRLLDAEGKELIGSNAVRLQRDFSYDPVNVLAKEAEEQRLYDEMQYEAAQQLLRRVATLMRQRER